MLLIFVAIGLAVATNRRPQPSLRTLKDPQREIALADRINPAPVADDPNGGRMPSAPPIQDAMLWASEHYPEVVDRINLQIDTVEHEDVNEGLDHLSRVEMFFWPGREGPMMEIPQIPLPPNSGHLDIDLILSNRRFLKLIEEIRALNAEEASRLLENQLDRALAEYETLYYKEVLQNPNLFDLTTDGNFGYQISDNNDDSATLQGARLAIFSLLWLAADSRLSSLQPAVDSVVHKALEQRDFLYGEGINKNFAFHVLKMGSLYNRPILATAILGTRSHDDAIEPFERRSTKYNAAVTNYDVLTRFGIPLDWTKGELKISHAANIDEATFNQLLDTFELPPVKS